MRETQRWVSAAREWPSRWRKLVTFSEATPARNPYAKIGQKLQPIRHSHANIRSHRRPPQMQLSYATLNRPR